MTATTTYVDNMNDRTKSLPKPVRRRVANQISRLGNYHSSIPLDAIFSILGKDNVIPLQEDGTEWSGFLCGGAEVGTEDARNQQVTIRLAFVVFAVNHALAGFDVEPPSYRLATEGLHISWAKMSSGRYEVVSYIL